MGEVDKGIEKMPNKGRRKILLQWVDEDLQERFRGRIIPFGLQAAAIFFCAIIGDVALLLFYYHLPSFRRGCYPMLMICYPFGVREAARLS